MWALSLTPAAVTVVQAATGRLGFDPIETLTDRTGWWAIVHLVVTLAVTPARRLLGWHWLSPFRRQLGLASFVYASLHLGVYAVLDLGLDVSHLAEDIAKRPFMTIGFVTWALLLVLAATSSAGAVRRLGRRWVTLHRLVYPAALLAALHYVWGKKTLEPLPLAFAVTIATLLATRLLPVMRPRRRGGDGLSTSGAPGARGTRRTPS